jgi:hypothetical protein
MTTLKIAERTKTNMVMRMKMKIVTWSGQALIEMMCRVTPQTLTLGLDVELIISRTKAVRGLERSQPLEEIKVKADLRKETSKMSN